MQSMMSSHPMSHMDNYASASGQLQMQGHQLSTVGGMNDAGGYEKSRSTVSSVVIGEEFLGEQPQHQSERVRYVEVPIIEEVVKHVPRIEIIEREKRVPKIEVEYVEKVVEVPQIQYVERTVPKVEVKEIIKEIPKQTVVDVPREVIVTVPKVETVVTEKFVEVKGDIIEVPKPYTVENKIPVNQYQDREVPVIVAQTIRPVLIDSDQVLEVEVLEYEPQVVVVEVEVAKPISTQFRAIGVTDRWHRLVQVPAAQYNTLLRALNPHLSQAKMDAELPYMSDHTGVSFLSSHQHQNLIYPSHGAVIEGYNAPVVHHESGGQVVVVSRSAPSIAPQPGLHINQNHSDGVMHPVHPVHPKPVCLCC